MSEETIRPEVEIRGTTLMASALIEGWIMNVVFFSNDDQYRNGSKESEYIKLKRATFGVKTNRIKKILEKYHIDLFIKYQELFERIDDFKILRDRIAHCMIVWDDNKPEIFNVLDVDVDSDRIEYSVLIPYNNRAVRNYLGHVISTIPYELIEVFEIVYQRLSVSHPARFAQLNEAYEKSKL